MQRELIMSECNFCNRKPRKSVINSNHSIEIFYCLRHEELAHISNVELDKSTGNFLAFVYKYRVANK